MNNNAIYTHDEASKIIELFEDILYVNDIIIPSPEDDEKDEDNMAAIYGSTYSDLLDEVENILVGLAERAKNGHEIITYKFSGNY